MARRQDAALEEDVPGRALLWGSGSIRPPAQGQRRPSQDLPSPRVIQHRVPESPRVGMTAQIGVIAEGRLEGAPSPGERNASGQAEPRAVSHSEGGLKSVERMERRGPVVISEKKVSKAGRMQDQPSASLLTERSQRPIDGLPSHGTKEMLDMPTASLLTERTNAPSWASASTEMLTDRTDASSTHHGFPPVSIPMQRKKAMTMKHGAGAGAAVPLSLVPPIMDESKAITSRNTSIRHMWSSEVAGIHAVTKRMRRWEDDTLMRDEPLEEVTVLEALSTEGQLWRKGVKPGSRLLCVDGAEVEGMELLTLKSLIEGDEGTPVVLEVVCGGGGGGGDGGGGEGGGEGGGGGNGMDKMRVSVMRSRSPMVDAAMTAYQEALTMLAGEKVAPLDSSSDVVCHMHRKVASQIESLLGGKARAEASLDKARKMLEERSQDAGGDGGIVEELERVQMMMEEDRKEREGEREALFEASAEERRRMGAHVADLECMMREMAVRYDESIAGYVAMEREAIAYVSLRFDIDFEEVRVRPERFEQQLRREVSEALHVTIDRCAIVSLHRGSTIAVIEFLPPVQDDDFRSPNVLVDELLGQALNIAEAQAQGETQSSRVKGRGILSRTVVMNQVAASEISVMFQRFREELKGVCEERDTLVDELDAAQAKIKAQDERIRSLERLEDSWKETVDKLAYVEALVGKDEAGLMRETMTKEAVIGDAQRAKDLYEEEKKRHASEREQLMAGMRELEEDVAAAKELASSRQAKLTALERQLVVGMGEAQGLRGRLEEIRVLREELEGAEEREAKIKTVISKLELEKEALEKELGESRKEVEEARLQLEESRGVIAALGKEMISKQQLAVVKDSFEAQIKDLSRQLEDADKKHFEIGKTLKETARKLLEEEDGGGTKSKSDLDRMLQAEKARCEKLRLDLLRKENEVQAERIRQEGLVDLSGKDSSAALASALLRLRDETIVQKEKEISHMNRTIEDLEAEVPSTLPPLSPSRCIHGQHVPQHIRNITEYITPSLFVGGCLLYLVSLEIKIVADSALMSFVQLMGIDKEESLRLMRSIKELLGDSSLGVQAYAGSSVDDQGSPVQSIMLQAQAREIARLQDKLLMATKASIGAQIMS